MQTMRWVSLFFFGVALLALFCCDLPALAPQSRFEKIATGYCECTARLAVINKQADTADRAQLGAYFQKMQTEFYKAKDCTATIIGQFGHLKPAELDTVNMILKTKCPDLADKREQLQELLGE
ncbi:MAG: hypothetical protein IPM98_07790 [Lewinellaceae bacterium]|nr:hypothetical protein [Lewinellaceae bacterium]